MSIENILEKAGILKHHTTIAEVEEGEVRLRELTHEYMTGSLSLEKYKEETKKLPHLDLRALSRELNY